MHHVSLANAILLAIFQGKKRPTAVWLAMDRKLWRFAIASFGALSLFLENSGKKVKSEKELLGPLKKLQIFLKQGLVHTGVWRRKK